MLPRKQQYKHNAYTYICAHLLSYDAKCSATRAYARRAWRKDPFERCCIDIALKCNNDVVFNIIIVRVAVVVVVVDFVALHLCVWGRLCA